MNSTMTPMGACAGPSCFNSTSAVRTPFYHTDRAEYVPGISDHTMTAVGPLVAYWALSLLFHALDVSGWRWLDKYRLHESAEVRARNLVGRAAVVRAVVFQQVLQTILALWWVEPQPHVSSAEHALRAAALAPAVRTWVCRLVGEHAGKNILAHQEHDLVYFVYWWAIPVLQTFFAMCVFRP